MNEWTDGWMDRRVKELRKIGHLTSHTYVGPLKPKGSNMFQQAPVQQDVLPWYSVTCLKFCVKP